MLAKSGQPFISFGTGLPYEWEHYKEVIYHEGRDLLAASTWEKADIGSGSILRRVREAIEIVLLKKEGAEQIVNNLVDWDLRFGRTGQSHKSLLEAMEDEHKWHAYESLLFDFYRDESPSEAALEATFVQLMNLAGKRYDFIAYLFFLKNWEQFLPISPGRIRSRLSDARDQLANISSMFVGELPAIRGCIASNSKCAERREIGGRAAHRCPLILLDATTSQVAQNTPTKYGSLTGTVIYFPRRCRV